MKGEIVARGLRFLEGPVWRDDGTLLVTSVGEGVLYRVWPSEGRHEVFAETRGGPNGAAPCADGGVLVTQNGGFDFRALTPDAPEYRPVAPGLQRVAPDGMVATVVEGDLNAPNDLVVAPDGTVYFTDPGPYPPLQPPVGRVMALTPLGGLETVARDFVYCNGIGREPGGTLVVVESHGLMRLLPDGGREWVVESFDGGSGDGFCLDAEGNFYVADPRARGVRVISAQGKQLDWLEVPDGGVLTNCCFGGPDFRTLYATEMLPGGVVAWDGMPIKGAPLTPWPT